jgi:glycerophosphoryl diester phosphodiesterase
MAIAPENTLRSFRRALDDGACFVEFDVCLSRDREVVIIHDPTLERTTNGSGEVSAHTVEDLKRLDAGYHFTEDGGMTYPYRGEGVEVPLLEDFFAAFPQTRAIVELKSDTPPIVTRTLDIIRRFHAEERVLLATEDDQIMAEIRKALRQQHLAIATGFSYGEVATFIRWVQSGAGTPFTPAGQALQIPCEYQGITLVSPETVNAAHFLGLEVYVWTINDPDEMKRLISIGVDGIITDYPSRLCSLVSRAV